MSDDTGADHGPKTTEPGYGTVNTDYAIQLATTPPEDDGPVWMLNLMQYREVADYGEDSDEPTRTGQDADDAYMPWEALQGVGAEVVYAADVETQPYGEGKPWDRVAIVRYPTRRSFIDMQKRGDFQKKYHHKEAGMERSIIIGCQPAGGAAGPVDAEAHVLRVIRWADDAPLEPPTMAVEAAIVGDGRTWHAVTLESADEATLAPSPEADDEYVIVVRPTLNTLLTSFS